LIECLNNSQLWMNLVKTSPKIDKVKKLALSIRHKRKVKDIFPIYDLGEKEGLTQEEINYCIKYAGL